VLREQRRLSHRRLEQIFRPSGYNQTDDQATAIATLSRYCLAGRNKNALPGISKQGALN
jgi:hypothetical protein